MRDSGVHLDVAEQVLLLERGTANVSPGIFRNRAVCVGGSRGSGCLDYVERAGLYANGFRRHSW